MIKHIALGIGLLAACCVFAPRAAATQTTDALELPAFFSDHMVIQRDRPIRLWGKSAPDKRVEALMGEKRNSAVSGADGSWRLELPSVSARGPYTIEVSDGTTTRTFGDVLAGEVWLCSGQSNMAWRVEQANNATTEIASANYPDIRFYTPPMAPAPNPSSDIPDRPEWIVCSPRSAGLFSAVGYFFACELQKRLGVPVGIINSSLGSTTVQLWTSREALAGLPEFRDEVGEIEADLRDPVLAQQRYKTRIDAWMTGLERTDPGSSVSAGAWYQRDIDPASWRAISVPGNWERAGLGAFDGAVWFRKEFELTQEQAASSLTLGLGNIDDSDITWLNGIRVGAADAAVQKRLYAIPRGVAVAGRNTLAVCVVDIGGDGGFVSSPDQLQLIADGPSASTSIPLSGKWQYRVSRPLADIAPRPPPPDFPWRLGCLFNGMIAPFAGYQLRGVLWYQGEGNSPDPELYSRLLPALIQDWREHWNQGEFPFLFVQLPNYIPPPRENWVGLREAQAKTLGVAGTAMACTIDIGEANNIHPGKKREVGARLARLALADVYHQNVVSCGPVFTGVKSQNGAMSVSFAHADSGLKTRDGGRAKGFSVAGSDREFVEAEAELDGNTAKVRSVRVPQPVAVRYAWSNNPDCNLVGDDSLPAYPFRSDNW